MRQGSLYSREVKNSALRPCARFLIDRKGAARYAYAMSDKFPCLLIKRQQPNGQSWQVIIGPSLLRWIFILFLAFVLLLWGDDPAQLLRDLLHL